MLKTRIITALNAVTATTTSNKFYVGGARRIGLLVRRADHVAGSTAFTVKGSMETPETVTPTMTALNIMIDNVTNSNVQTLTRIATKTLSANGDAFLWFDPFFFINFLEITATETTDGTHSAFIVFEEEA